MSLLEGRKGLETMSCGLLKDRRESFPRQNKEHASFWGGKRTSNTDGDLSLSLVHLEVFLPPLYQTISEADKPLHLIFALSEANLISFPSD